MTTSVIQAVKIISSTSSMVMILSGMVKDVVHTALAAPGTILHGMRQCPGLQLVRIRPYLYGF